MELDRDTGMPDASEAMSSYDPDSAHQQQELDELAFSKAAQITLSCLYVLTIIFSVSGNTLVIIVLWLGKRSSYNLTRLLINLAFSDIVMAVFCMPFTFVNFMLGRWLFGRFMCKGVGFMQVTSVAASIYTNVAIGLDRYLAVSNPLRRRVSKLNPLLVVASIWLFSALFAAPELKVLDTSQVVVRETGNVTVAYTICHDVSSPVVQRSYSLLISLVTYLLPLVALFTMYSLIGKALWRQRSIPGHEDRRRSLARRQSRLKVTKMLCILVLTFAVCWLPFHILTIVNQFTPSRTLLAFVQSSPDLFFAIYCSCHWLAMANSFTNPIIYNFLSDDFRHDLKSIVRRESLSQSDGHTFTQHLSRLRSTSSRRRLSPNHEALLYEHITPAPKSAVV